MSQAAAERIRSVPWGVKQAIVVFLLPWIILPAFIILLIVISAEYLPVLQPFVQAIDDGEPRVSLALALIDAVGSFAVIRYYLRKHGVGWSELGFRRFNPLKALLYVGGLFIAFIFVVQILYVLVQVLVPGFNPDQEQVNEFTNIGSNFHTYALIALVVLPPFIEEPVFRGFLFPAFAKRFGLIGAAFFTSVLFGFAHLQANVSVYTFAIGLVLCFLYVRLGSIWPGIGLHMVNNYIAFMALSQK